jgi:hypothetical protein
MVFAKSYLPFLPFTEKYDFANTMKKKLNLMQIHLHEVKILQIHNARPELVKKYHDAPVNACLTLFPDYFSMVKI